MSRPARVVVVGGGITGLSLAFTLTEDASRAGAPLSLTVLEAAPRLGGHAQTKRADGFLIESGPNGFLSRGSHTVALVDELGLTPRLVEARPESKRRFILRGGRLCRVPDGPATLLTSPALSWRGKLRLLCEPFASGPPAGVEEAVYEFARRRIGSEAAEMLVDAAVSGISGGDSRQLSVTAQFPKMVEMERDHGSLVRALFARRRAPVKPSTLLSFDEGMGTLTGALVRRLGSAVHAGTAAGSIERAGDTWLVRTAGGATVDADHVVLAVAARAAAPLVRGFDPALSASLGDVRYAGIAVVALGYDLADVPRSLDGYGYLVTRAEQMATLGVVWESSLFPGRAPDGAALLRVMLGGSRRPAIVRGPDDEKAGTAREELARVMGIRAEPRHVSVQSWPDAIAQYTVGHHARRAAMLNRLRLHAGLTVCGTSYDGVAFNDAVASGRLMARQVARRFWGDGSPSADEPAAAMAGA